MTHARRQARWLGLAVAMTAAVVAAVVLAVSPRGADAQTLELQLEPQWNLVASPVTGTPEGVSGNMLRVRSIHRWNATEQVFESWRRGAPDFANTLEHVERGEGIWVEVSGTVPWDVPPPGEVTVPIGASGFRLVGWVEETVSAQEALARVHGEQIFGWNNFLNRFETYNPDLPAALNTLEQVERGYAYWVLFELGGLPPIELVPVFTANNPIDVVPTDGGEVLVVQQEGLVRRVNPATGVFGTTLMDIRDRVEFGGEQGLLSVTPAPDYATSGLIYAYYSVAGQSRTRLSRFTIKDGALLQTSEMIVLQVSQPEAFHNGGQIAFGPDGYLYLSIGDGGIRQNGQDLSTLLGSVIRIDVDQITSETPYHIPDDNPFVGQAGAAPEIYAYGLRNPWRMAFDPVTERLWVGDPGANTTEEINLIEAGGNYGWATLEGAECYTDPACSAAGTTLPVASYAAADGNCAVIGGVVYRGRAYEELQGVYLFGDFCSGRIWGVAAEGAVGEPQLMATDVGDIVSFGRDSAGEVYVVTQSGQIYKIVAP